jgi:hypothetical protein
MIPNRPGALFHAQRALAAKKRRKKLQHLFEEMEAIEPTVRAILDDIVIQHDGVKFIDNYASWVKALRKLPPTENTRVFVQLAVLAGQFFDADCTSVAMNLAALARIGLLRLTPHGTKTGPPTSPSGSTPVNHTRNF